MLLLCVFKVIFKLNSRWIQHPLTTWLNPHLLDSQLCAHLECQTRGANHDLQINVFVGLMNALCYCRQTLPWPKILTNYLDDNWLCTINIAPRLDRLVLFAHSFGGGKLMITSPSHLKAQIVAFRTWMKIEAHDHKWYFTKDHDTKKHDQWIIWLFLC